MIDCSLYKQSSELSLENMQQMAITESMRNHFAIRHIMTPTISYITPHINSQVDQLDEEHNLQKGLRITKKSCIFKRPEYNEGSWTQQFGRILPSELENRFNIESKQKMPILSSDW